MTSAIREMEDQLHTAELLDDPNFILNYCFQFLQRMGYDRDDIDGLVCATLRGWREKEDAAEEALQQKYEAAMAEKRGRALRKHWPGLAR